tara:strand:- start:3857 stop:5296 length:1440 start_codon:yes stop_codon:yes gene_type:complete
VSYSAEDLALYPLGTLDDWVANEPTQGSYESLRGISKETMEFYDVKTVVSRDGAPLSQAYVYPSGATKTRLFPKDFRATGKMDGLFGQNRFTAGTSKMVTITEGELDALSAWQMLGGASSRYATPVVSLPSANPSKAFWETVIPWLDSFQKIVLSVDSDGPGDEVAQKINSLFPQKTYRVDHSIYKDANDFLQSNKAAEYKSAWFGATRFTPDNLLHSEADLLSLFDDTPEHSFVPTGIPEFDGKAMGLHRGHFTMFKAATGIGKTEVFRFLEWNFINRGVTFATCHLEEIPLRSVLGLVSYDLNDNLTRKDLIEEKGKTEEVRESIKRLAETEHFYQFKLREGDGADELVQQVKMMATVYGCQFVMIEPIQDTITTASESSKESELAQLAIRLSKVAAEYNIGIITIAHTNENGDAKYCKMLSQRASVVIDLHRDKDAEDAFDRNTTKLVITKNRPTSEEGFAGEMSFDLSTFTLTPL